MTQICRREHTQEISPSCWTNFCEMLTEENQGRVVVVENYNDETKDIAAIADTLVYEPNYSVLYGFNHYSSLSRNCFIVIFDRKSSDCNHIVENPKKIEVLYKHGSQILAVVVTDETRAQTVIYFEGDADAMTGGLPQLQLLRRDQLQKDKIKRDQLQEDQLRRDQLQKAQLRRGQKVGSLA